MSKNLLVIKGSARKNGYSNKLAEYAVNLLVDYNVTVFDTCSADFKACTGCNFCEQNRKCIFRDLDDFFEAFEKADLIIFASPVYNGTFSAQLKALLDRFQVFYTGFYSSGKIQQIKKHRDAVFIAAAGSNDQKAFEYMQHQLECAFTILNLTLKKSVLCACTDTLPSLEKAMDDLKKELSDE